ncbi:hypothetical protein [Thiocapsa marina]|uniref:Uncharacterized protein n=1 Tax=Thiocapsa marina 5811 TaxID=768671 RepID=F9UHZ4_9GAMM|nr:hypothetical protein ThimaDRAFT_4547 [Thiocapsa marina 5811]
MNRVSRVGMMDPVQSPQRGHGMKQQVLSPDHEVEHHDRIVASWVWMKLSNGVPSTAEMA